MPKYVFEIAGQVYTRECENKEQLLAYIESILGAQAAQAAQAAKVAKVAGDLLPYKVKEE